jgi:hypothetical protein
VDLTREIDFCQKRFIVLIWWLVVSLLPARAPVQALPDSGRLIVFTANVDGFDPNPGEMTDGVVILMRPDRVMQS